MLRVLVCLLTMALTISVVEASEFVGSWKVLEVIENPEFPWHQEVKYPVEFTISENGSKLVGQYQDQWNTECEFSVVEEINDGAELILIHCGSTKSPSAWMPIHRVKRNGENLHGSVFTNHKLFEWIAVRK
jgi:hypothetical protein